MRGAIPPLHQYVFMAWCLINHGIRLHDVVLSEAQKLFVCWNVTQSGQFATDSGKFVTIIPLFLETSARSQCAHTVHSLHFPHPSFEAYFSELTRQNVSSFLIWEVCIFKTISTGFHSSASFVNCFVSVYYFLPFVSYCPWLYMLYFLRFPYFPSSVLITALLFLPFWDDSFRVGLLVTVMQLPNWTQRNVPQCDGLSTDLWILLLTRVTKWPRGQ
jgi:hypothetical protein